MKKRCFGVQSNNKHVIKYKGFIRIKPDDKGTYVLTASYIDHGLKSVPGKRLKGMDVVVIHSR